MKLLILYGSATGNAESIAKQLHEQAIDRGFEAILGPLNRYKKLGFLEAETTLIVTSTTGDGDAPENAERFVRYFKKRNLDPLLLQGKKYAVLALGDTNYSRFCNTGKLIDKSLSNLGATRLCQIACADEATGLEEVVERWKTDILEILLKNSSSQVDEEVIEPKENIPVVKDASSFAPLKKEILVLYGSATGNAEYISKEIHEQAAAHDLVSTWGTLNEYKKLGFMEKKLIVIVTSTTGDGDAPENANRFVRFIKRRTHDANMLKDKCFCVLALGDTNYSKFCNVGKQVDKSFSKLGGSRLMDITCADEATGLDDVVEPWKVKFWEEIDKLFQDGNLLQAEAGVASEVKPAETAGEQNQTESINLELINSEEPEQEVVGWKQPSFVYGFEELIQNSSVDLLKKKLSEVRPVRFPRCMAKVTFLGRESRSITNSSMKRGNERKTETPEDSVVGDSAMNPIIAQAVSARYLTTKKSSKRVVSTTFEIRPPEDSQSIPEWQPGDSIGVICPNPSLLVEGIIRRLGLSRDRKINVKRLSPGKPTSTPFFPQFDDDITIWEVLTWGVDLVSLPRKQFLRVLAEFCTNEFEELQLKLLANPVGKSEYKEVIENQQPSVLELLQMFPSCDPPLENLLSSLPALPPRFYSIANSPLGPFGYSRVQIAYTVVRNTVDYTENVDKKSQGEKRILSGVCTSWMESLCEQFLVDNKSPRLRFGQGNMIKVFIRPGSGFCLPADLSHPIVMIGAGTGIAPFIGFLEHLVYLEKIGEKRQLEMYDGFWRGLMDPCEGDIVDESSETKEEYGEVSLYTGCHHPEQDMLFHDKVADYEESSILNRFVCAFSRYGDNKKEYVQDKIHENGKLIVRQLLDESGYLYVCGRLQMATDVNSMLLKVFQEHGGLSAEEAKERIADMIKRGRYAKDVWG